MAVQNRNFLGKWSFDQDNATFIFFFRKDLIW